MADPSQPEAPQRRRRLADERGRVRIVGSLPIKVMAVLAVIFFLSWAQEIVMPMVFALFIYLVFIPPIRFLARYRIPPLVTAPAIILGLAGIGLAGIANLADPVSDWIQRIPSEAYQIERKLDFLGAPVKQVRRATEKVSQMTGGKNEPTSPGRDAERKPVIETEGLVGALLGTMRDIATHSAVTLVLAMFLLAGGDVLREKLVQSVERFGDKRRLYEIATEVENSVSTYLLTITLINFVLGSVIAAGFYAIGLPNPILFGIMAGVLNYIPYLGNLVGAAIVFVVALLSFDPVGSALMAPAVYLAASTVEGNFITPSILGRRIQVSAVFVFFGVIAGAWLWGVPGAFLAVPVLITLKAVADRTDSLGWLASTLARGRDRTLAGNGQSNGDAGGSGRATAAAGPGHIRHRPSSEATK